jgi:predicted regulator of Ras-like GTPase activity (Roadblock/LC7/MglB family)
MSQDDLDRQIDDFHWLLENFVHQTAGAEEAVAVSSDGFLLGASAGPDRPNIEQLAAVSAGLASLTRGAADCFEYGTVELVMVRMSRGFLFLSRISDGSCLAVLADASAEVASVAYEMTLLVERVGAILSPALVTELKNALVV